MRRVAGWSLVLCLAALGCGLKVPLDATSAGRLTSAESVDGAGTEAAAEGTQAAAGAENANAAAQQAAAAARNTAARGGTQTRAARLFPNDTEGLTDTTIKLCVHVPITGAAPIDRNPNRFGKFYFDYVNAELGGVHGRRVEYIAYDDQYNPPYAVAAAERCRSQGAFVIAGAAGTDQLVAVAKWAERNKIPYLMGPASVRDVATYTPYAKMIGPDYEFQHDLLADYLVREYGRDVNYGMVRINSPFFDAAHDAYVARLRTHGITLKVDEVVQKDENTFTRILDKLKANNVRVVNNFTTPTIWLKMMRQRQPDYSPTWTAVSPAAGYNLIAEALAGAGDALVFHHFGPAYPALGTDDQESVLARYPYAPEIRKFKEIFNKYATVEPKSPRDDIDWQAYLGAKGTHRLLLKLGRDITRTRLWTFLETYRETPQEAAPGCPADFTRRAHQGAWFVNVFKLGTRQWENVPGQLCIDRPPA